ARVVDHGAPARVQPRGPARAGGRSPADAQSGHPLPRARPPRTKGLDQGQLAEDRQQSRREVLRDHQDRRPRARAADRALAPALGARRQTVAWTDGLKTVPCGTIDMRRAMLRLLNVFRRDAAERELARELVAHLTLLEDDFRRRGM